jgi:hypothetical protein
MRAAPAHKYIKREGGGLNSIERRYLQKVIYDKYIVECQFGRTY